MRRGYVAIGVGLVLGEILAVVSVLTLNTWGIIGGILTLIALFLPWVVLVYGLVAGLSSKVAQQLKLGKTCPACGTYQRGDFCQRDGTKLT